jgi:hypothetical protein
MKRNREAYKRYHCFDLFEEKTYYIKPNLPSGEIEVLERTICKHLLKAVFGYTDDREVEV